VLALVVAALIWVFGQALGEMLTGSATDPNSAPLLALLALAYWPIATAGPRAGRPRADGLPAMAAMAADQDAVTAGQAAMTAGRAAVGADQAAGGDGRSAGILA